MHEVAEGGVAEVFPVLLIHSAQNLHQYAAMVLLEEFFEVILEKALFSVLKSEEVEVQGLKNRWVSEVLLWNMLWNKKWPLSVVRKVCLINWLGKYGKRSIVQLHASVVLRGTSVPGLPLWALRKRRSTPQNSCQNRAGSRVWPPS